MECRDDAGIDTNKLTLKVKKAISSEEQEEIIQVLGELKDQVRNVNFSQLQFEFLKVQLEQLSSKLV